MGVSATITSTITYPESNTHIALDSNVIAVTLDVTMAVKILRNSYENNPFYCHWTATLCAIERKVPSLATSGAAYNTKSSIKENTKRCFSALLVKDTFLIKKSFKRNIFMGT
jgi:hypothetical protein